MAREESGRVRALLAGRFQDVHLADDAVQDALIDAAVDWPKRGVPDNPAGWLLTVARRRAIDRLRRDASHDRRLAELGTESEGDDVGDVLLLTDHHETIDDDQLRLLLLCCHPALDGDAQVALTLRLVGGLTTPEIASAFLVPEATLAQRIVRAKRKIRDARIPLSLPERLDDRLDAVLAVLYLVFNEAYLSRSERDDIVRHDLAAEAIRLTRICLRLVPDESSVRAELEGLLALELFHHARAATRLDGAGILVLLDQQDRSRWDLAMIREANELVTTAMARLQPGPYQVQALIAAHHANAVTAADTDWSTIAALYKQLEQMTRSPVVALNHAVALAMADGPEAGLAALAPLTERPELVNYHLLHAARGELLLRSGRLPDASSAFTEARRLATTEAERRHLDTRLAECAHRARP